VLTSSRLLALAGLCVAVLLLTAVGVLLARTGRGPSPEDLRDAGERRDRTGPHAPSDTPTPRAGQR
jgi:hypothetical protein